MLICSVCQKPFDNTYDIYRCVDCEMPFHRNCIREVHFKEQVSPNQIHEFERTKYNLIVALKELHIAQEELLNLDKTARELLDNARLQLHKV